MNKLYFLSLFLIFLTPLAAQTPDDNYCGTHTLYLENIKKYPGYQQAVESVFEKARAQAAKIGKQQDDTIFRIPVVFHIVYRLAAENIHDSLIHNQIDVLNKDFNRLNADTGNTRDVFKPFAGSARIEFYLATADPNGQPTTGIVRKQTTKAYFGSSAGGNIYQIDNIKRSSTGGDDAWDVEHYMNIWVGNINGPSSQSIIYGYAYPPANLSNWMAGSSAPSPALEGVVVYYPAMGYHNPASTSAAINEGRTTTHEVGHYLGLRHIWGDGGCGVDDGIEDTPDANAATQFNCPNKNTCVEAGTQYPDQIENYMDYSDERCRNMFSHGQIALMRSVLRINRPLLAQSIMIGGPVNPPASISVTPYPNPFNDYITLNFSGPLDQELNVEVFDILGHKLKEIKLQTGMNNAQIDMYEQPNAVYVLRYILYNKEYTHKLIKL